MKMYFYIAALAAVCTLSLIGCKTEKNEREKNDVRAQTEKIVRNKTDYGKTAVDLGLPSGLKWAACNVGASSPEEAGLYFAWGETTGYSLDAGHVFDKTNYKAAGIGKDLTLEQDAAHVNLGGNWRMPTKAEFEELIEQTEQKWTDDYEGTGMAGCIFKSKTNDNAIFLPACGNFKNSSSVSIFGGFGYYWTSTYHSENGAWLIRSGDRKLGTYDNVRFYGRSIRGVTQNNT